MLTEKGKQIWDDLRRGIKQSNIVINRKCSYSTIQKVLTIAEQLYPASYQKYLKDRERDRNSSSSEKMSSKKSSSKKKKKHTTTQFVASSVEILLREFSRVEQLFMAEILNYRAQHGSKIEREMAKVMRDKWLKLLDLH